MYHMYGYIVCIMFLLFFFFNDTATTEIYTVLTHSFPTRRSSDLPKSFVIFPFLPCTARSFSQEFADHRAGGISQVPKPRHWLLRSEEHTSELQSLMRNSYAVFCLKKKKKMIEQITMCNETYAHKEYHEYRYTWTYVTKHTH